MHKTSNKYCSIAGCCKIQCICCLLSVPRQGYNAICDICDCFLLNICPTQNAFQIVQYGNAAKREGYGWVSKNKIKLNCQMLHVLMTSKTDVITLAAWATACWSPFLVLKSKQNAFNTIKWHFASTKQGQNIELWNFIFRHKYMYKTSNKYWSIAGCCKIQCICCLLSVPCRGYNAICDICNCFLLNICH